MVSVRLPTVYMMGLPGISFMCILGSTKITEFSKDKIVLVFSFVILSVVK